MSGIADTIEKHTKFKNIKAVADYDEMRFEGKDTVLIHRYIENIKTGHMEFEDDFEENPGYTLKQFNSDYRPWLNTKVKEINQNKYLTGKIAGCKVGEVLIPNGKWKKEKHDTKYEMQSSNRGMRGVKKDVTELMIMNYNPKTGERIKPRVAG